MKKKNLYFVAGMFGKRVLTEHVRAKDKEEVKKVSGLIALKPSKGYRIYHIKGE